LSRDHKRGSARFFVFSSAFLTQNLPDDFKLFWEMSMTDLSEIEAESLWTSHVDGMAKAFVQGWPDDDEDLRHDTIMRDCMGDARMTAEVALRIAALASPAKSMRFLTDLSSARRGLLGLATWQSPNREIADKAAERSPEQTTPHFG